MAKLKDDPVDKVILSKYLSEFSDFGFEIRVLKMLRTFGLECEHGGHYDDPVTGKSREFDIRAEKTFGQLRVRMAIECKNIRPNFPILVSCIPRHEEESYHQVAAVKDRYSNVMGQQVSRARTYNIRGQYSLYRVGCPVGKSIAQVGCTLDGKITANDSELFEKWGQCLGSANDLIKRIYWDGDEDDELDAYISAVLPFVVVPNERLWVVNYDDCGDEVGEPEMVEQCSCFVNKRYRLGTEMAFTTLWVSHVEFVTFDGLRNFVSDFLTSEQAMEGICSREGLGEAMGL